MFLVRTKSMLHTLGAAAKWVNCYTSNCIFTGDRTMLNQKFFEDMSAKLNEVVANSPARDFEKNARALMAQGFAKLDLVTREEFDVQAQVLARAREQLTALEARIAELEAQRK